MPSRAWRCCTGRIAAVDGSGLWSSTGGHSLFTLKGETVLWLPLRWGLGFVAPLVLGVMVWQTAKIRSTHHRLHALIAAQAIRASGQNSRISAAMNTSQQSSWRSKKSITAACALGLTLLVLVGTPGTRSAPGTGAGPVAVPEALQRHARAAGRRPRHHLRERRWVRERLPGSGGYTRAPAGGPPDPR